MKKRSLMLLLALVPLALCAQIKPDTLAKQDTVAYTVSSLGLDTNTVNRPSLTLVLNTSFTTGEITGDYYNNGYKPKLHVDYKGKVPKCPLELVVGVRKTKLTIKFTNLTQETIVRFGGKDNALAIVFDEDLFFKYRTDPNGKPKDYTYGRISKDTLNKVLKEQLSFPADAQTRFLTAVNTMYYYKNSADFGVEPSKDSSSFALVLNFNYQNLYSAGSLLNCGANSGSSGHTLVYYSVSTRLSTNPKDSLNFINIYPLVIQGSNYGGKGIIKEWALKAGHESSEDFSYRRVAVDGSISMILPNLVNLTSAASTRLRLKPVIDLGLKGYDNYSKGVTSFISGQAYLNAYYYIPVYDHYAIIINDKTFYDFSAQTNPKKELASNYSVAIGTEIPKSGFKVMFKYQDGKSEFNKKETQAVVLGLIMNLFNDKPAQ